MSVEWPLTSALAVFYQVFLFSVLDNLGGEAAPVFHHHSLFYYLDPGVPGESLLSQWPSFSGLTSKQGGQFKQKTGARQNSGGGDGVWRTRLGVFTRKLFFNYYFIFKIFFFLMWTILKSLLNLLFFFFVFFFCFFFLPRGLWDLSSLTRDVNFSPLNWKVNS